MRGRFYKDFEKVAKIKEKVQLKPHQKRVVKRLRDSTDSLLLYHGLGSGKTLSSIAATEGLNTDVVVPASLRPNYLKELAKFTTLPASRDVMSYEKASKGLTGGDALVLDEVQRINNPATARAASILKAAPLYKKRVLLSGTPIRNYPHELAPILKVLDPEGKKVPTDVKKFQSKFIKETPIDPGLLNRLMGVKPGFEYDAKNLNILQKAIEGRVDYYEPDSTNYPLKKERIALVPMSPEQSRIYSYVTGRANPAIARKVRKNLPLSKIEAKQLNAFMSATRQIGNTTRPFGGTEDSPKLLRARDELKDRLRRNPNYKAMAYSNYLDGGVKEYARLLDEKKISNRLFTGEMSDKEKKKTVNDFNKGKFKVLLISGAGSEGIDLKGTRMVQILEPHWNKARIDQAIGRAARYKSHEHLPQKDRNVEVVHYHSAHPAGWLARKLSRKSPTAADTYLYELSKKKDLLNQKFLDILKEEGMRYHHED